MHICYQFEQKPNRKVAWGNSSWQKCVSAVFFVPPHSSSELPPKPVSTDKKDDPHRWRKGGKDRRRNLAQITDVTNICPQNKEMNNGVWHQIENLARKLAVRYDSVQIVCGPIFVSNTPETIGPHRVWIPDSFFKAFLIKHQDAYHTIAFICPNNSDSVTVVGTARSVNTVETFTGYDFFGFLDDSVEETAEDEVEVGLWVR